MRIKAGILSLLVVITITMSACDSPTASSSPAAQTEPETSTSSLTPMSTSTATVTTNSPAPTISIAASPSPINSFQKTVNALKSLAPGSVPTHFFPGSPGAAEYARTSDDFDVNAYFTVLAHLSPEPGYVLDYVYTKDTYGGQPYLYARKSTEPQYNTTAGFAEAIKISPNKPEYREKFLYGYLDHVKVDDTQEGFFQFVALRMMGGQFYLAWHGGYNDSKLVCDQRVRDDIISGLRNSGATEEEFSSKLKQMRQLDVEPKIEMQENQVVVKVVTFSQWGGFKQETYTIARQFPHQFIDIKSTTLVPYDCGMRF